MRDLNVVHAAHLARVVDSGGPRRGVEQGELNLLEDGALAIRDGVIVAVDSTEGVLREWGGVTTLDASGMSVLPGLIEGHSHPLFAGERHHEYAERLAGASLQEVARRGGGIWASVESTRSASDDELSARLDRAYEKILAGGATTLEVKSGYGLTTDSELRQLRLLHASRAVTPLSLVVTFLGAHIVPPGMDADSYTRDVAAMLPEVKAMSVAAFHDVTCEAGIFTPAQAEFLFDRSRALSFATKAHVDAWSDSKGWQTAVAGGAVSAEHLTYSSDEAILEVGVTDTIAVLLPQAELVYMTDRRANARLFIDQQVPVVIATDYCSSIHATSLTSTLAFAAPWYRMTPAEVIVGATLNAAYALGCGHDRGSLDVAKRGDVTVLNVSHPEEACLAAGQGIVAAVVIGGEVALSNIPHRIVPREEP